MIVGATGFSRRNPEGGPSRQSCRNALPGCATPEFNYFECNQISFKQKRPEIPVIMEIGFKWLPRKRGHALIIVDPV